MSNEVGYENVKCQIGLPGCQKKNAGYSRYRQYAKVGPALDACETCAKKPYEQPLQFKTEEDPAQGF